MKYFFYPVDMVVFSVPRKYFQELSIIENAARKNVSDSDINKAIRIIIDNCKVKIKIAACSQFL